MDSAYWKKNMRRMRDPHAAVREAHSTKKLATPLDMNELKMKMGYGNLRDSLPQIKIPNSVTNR